MSISKITGQKVKIAYHGSPYLFEDIDLSRGGFLKDFGQGFYLSDTEKHAFLAGRKKAIALECPQVYLYTYELPVNWPSFVNKHVFKDANSNWLDFIVRNRKNMPVEFYDVVYGPTADAKAAKIIDRYIAGEYKKGNMTQKEVEERVLKDLKVYRYDRQVCIRTNRVKELINRIDMKVINL